MASESSGEIVEGVSRPVGPRRRGDDEFFGCVGIEVGEDIGVLESAEDRFIVAGK